MSDPRSWREVAAPRIAAVIARVGLEDRKALKSALREAYPFYERKYWPYKVWCDECRRQIEGPRPKPTPADLPPPGPALFEDL